MKVLYLLSHLSSSGAARQVLFLTTGLPPERYTFRVLGIGRDGVFGNLLRAAGVESEAVGQDGVFDLRGWRRLIEVCDTFRPDVIHAWREAVGHAVVLNQSPLRFDRHPAALVASEAYRGYRVQGPTWADRALWKRFAWMIAGDTIEATRITQSGYSAGRITVVPPAVAPVKGINRQQLLNDLGFPADSQVIVAAGSLEPNKGSRSAVWAYDILRQLMPGLALVLVGNGSRRAEVERFTHGIMPARVRFTGERVDVPALLHAADVVWVTDQAQGGRTVALEALIAGRPLVACDTPVLREVIGSAAVFVAPQDRAGFAKQTRFILEDQSLARSLAEAGLTRAAGYAPERLVQRVNHVYETAAAGQIGRVAS